MAPAGRAAHCRECSSVHAAGPRAGLPDQPRRRAGNPGLGRRTPAADRPGAARRHVRLSAGRPDDRRRPTPGRPGAIVSAGLRPQYRGANPQVTVSIKNPAGYQFSVIGKVRNPGTFTPGRYVNALEALSIAGGPTEFAQVGNVSVIRKSGQQLQTIRVRLNEVLKGDTSGLPGRNSVHPKRRYAGGAMRPLVLARAGATGLLLVASSPGSANHVHLPRTGRGSATRRTRSCAP